MIEGKVGKKTIRKREAKGATLFLPFRDPPKTRFVLLDTYKRKRCFLSLETRILFIPKTEEHKYSSFSFLLDFNTEREAKNNFDDCNKKKKAFTGHFKQVCRTYTTTVITRIKGRGEEGLTSRGKRKERRQQAVHRAFQKLTNNRRVSLFLYWCGHYNLELSCSTLSTHAGTISPAFP